MLLVGESPPASGRHFYAANSGLYRAIRHAFVASQLLSDSEDVRDCFRDNGWLLRDLSPQPLNRLDDASRREAHRVGVVPLARAIRASCPEAIVVIVAGIGPHARQAIQLAEWSGSYPSSKNVYRGTTDSRTSESGCSCRNASICGSCFHA